MIKTGQYLSQKLSQQQKLSPQQIQFIKLLQLPTLAFEQRIKEELDLNPLLEIVEPEESAEELTDLEKESEQTEESEENLDELETTDDLNEIDEADWNELLHADEIESYTPTNTTGDEEDKSRIEHKDEGSFLEYIEAGLDDLLLSGRERLIADQIVGSLDDDGYFRRDIQSLIDGIAFNYQTLVTDEEVESVLKKIQKLDPIGIASRNLRECLMVQLELLEDNIPGKYLLYNIIKDDWNAFEKKHYERLLLKFDVDEDALREALEVLKFLNPKPGATTSPDNKSAGTITPDFKVYYDPEGESEIEDRKRMYKNGFVVKPYRELRNPVTISRKYQKMYNDIKEQKKVGISNIKIKETESFLKDRIDSAKWFIESINQRENTLLSVMWSIVDIQETFFRTGKGIKPMILKDVADMVKMDISTISRVVNGKYVETPYGIYELKYFFNEGVQTDSGEEVANRVIKNALLQIVDNEDKSSPLSDRDLVLELKKVGYPVARRTISKYRDQLNIPVARLRKSL